MCRKEVTVMDEMFAAADDGNTVTTSRLRLWWLVYVRGCQVSLEMEQPKGSPFGGIRFVRHWSLLDPSRKTDEAAATKQPGVTHGRRD